MYSWQLLQGVLSKRIERELSWTTNLPLLWACVSIMRLLIIDRLVEVCCTNWDYWRGEKKPIMHSSGYMADGYLRYLSNFCNGKPDVWQWKSLSGLATVEDIYSSRIFLSINFWNAKAKVWHSEIYQQELFNPLCCFRKLSKLIRNIEMKYCLVRIHWLSELGGLDNQVHHLSNQVYSSSQEPVTKSRQHLFLNMILKER